MVRLLVLLLCVLLIGTGLVLGYIAVIAARRNEGVFLPAGYVALFCLAGAYLLGRTLLRG